MSATKQEPIPMKWQSTRPDSLSRRINSTERPRLDIKLYKENEDDIPMEVKTNHLEKIAGSPHTMRGAGSRDKTLIRERVNIHGKGWPMEPKERISALKLQPEVGIIKEDPLNKWWSGQKE